MARSSPTFPRLSTRAIPRAYQTPLVPPTTTKRFSLLWKLSSANSTHSIARIIAPKYGNNRRIRVLEDLAQERRLGRGNLPRSSNTEQQRMQAVRRWLQKTAQAPPTGQDRRLDEDVEMDEHTTNPERPHSPRTGRGFCQ